jgi:hypothetical protein
LFFFSFIYLSLLTKERETATTGSSVLEAVPVTLYVISWTSLIHQKILLVSVFQVGMEDSIFHPLFVNPILEISHIVRYVLEVEYHILREKLPQIKWLVSYYAVMPETHFWCPMLVCFRDKSERPKFTTTHTR